MRKTALIVLAGAALLLAGCGSAAGPRAGSTAELRTATSATSSWGFAVAIANQGQPDRSLVAPGTLMRLARCTPVTELERDVDGFDRVRVGGKVWWVPTRRVAAHC